VAAAAAAAAAAMEPVVFVATVFQEYF